MVEYFLEIIAVVHEILCCIVHIHVCLELTHFFMYKYMYDVDHVPALPSTRLCTRDLSTKYTCGRHAGACLFFAFTFSP